jgi:pimeloyl-ACP methyl ester carboxylesterase
MALPALVLGHGGGLAADSWELTAAEIQRLAPDLAVLALYMPGRRSKPALSQPRVWNTILRCWVCDRN